MRNGQKNINIAEAFSKGFVDSKGSNKTPAYFAKQIRNARVDNGAITVRRGFIQRIASSLGTHIRGIKGNDINNTLVVALDGKLYKADTSTRSYTLVGSIGGDFDVNFITHNKYTIILTGNTKPYVYDGTTLTLTTSTAPDVNPRIGARFAGFTCIVGNTDATKSTLYISRPITQANPEYAYDWVGSGSETIKFASEIVGITGTNNNLFIFTKETIEVITRDQLSTSGGVASLYSVPVGQGDQLAGVDCIVQANDKVFFLTKTNKIKTLNFVQGTIDTAVGDLSQRPLLNINGFLENLDDDQSLGFGFLNDRENTIQRHLKTLESAFNDIVLVYDFVNDTRLCDDNKYFSGITKFNSNFYAGSVLNGNLYQDDINRTDNGFGIPFYYESNDINFGNVVQRKQFRGLEIAGEMDELAVISIQIIVDGSTVFSDTIDKTDLEQTTESLGIGADEIGGETIGGGTGEIVEPGLQPFHKVITQSRIRAKGKKIKMILECDSPGADYYFDYLTFFVCPLGNYELADKF